MTCLNQTGTIPSLELGVHLCCKRVVLGDLISQLATDHESQMVKIFVYLRQAIGSISPQSQSHLALGLGPWLAMYAQVSHASAIRSMRDVARGCLCRGTLFAIYDC